jgi:AraC-like DNA-binding protein
VLQVVRLDSTIHYHAEFSEPWCVRAPESRQVAPILAPGSEYVIVFHLLCAGRAYARVEGGENVELRAGDIVTFPHGHGHFLGAGPSTKPVEAIETLPRALAKGLSNVRTGGGGPKAKFICGYLACDPRVSGSLLAGLPPLLRVNIRDDASGHWLETSLQASVDQAIAGHPGARGVLAKLSEALFAETLRRYLRDLPAEERGWLAATRDPGTSRALAIVHERYAEPWTVESLAREVGLSRTALADRFRHFLGVPPMTYLTRWRLQLGARALATTTRGVAEIAADVGYESEAAFNRAFKREYGEPPARYRKAIRERGRARAAGEGAAPRDVRA